MLIKLETEIRLYTVSGVVPDVGKNIIEPFFGCNLSGKFKSIVANNMNLLLVRKMGKQKLVEQRNYAFVTLYNGYAFHVILFRTHKGKVSKPKTIGTNSAKCPLYRCFLGD